MNFYAEDKIRELERDLAFRDKNQIFVEQASPRRKPVVGGVVAVAGRVLQRVGSGLEGWAAPAEKPGYMRRVTR